MQKLALAALAVALASVMAISAGPANAQRWENRGNPALPAGPIVGNTSTWGMMRPPGFTDRYVNRYYGGGYYNGYYGPRYSNRYVVNQPAPFVNAGPIVGNTSTWGLMRPPGFGFGSRYIAPGYNNNYVEPQYVNRYVGPRYGNRYYGPRYINRYSTPTYDGPAPSLIEDDY